MRITQESEYALRIVLYLSKLEDGEIATGKEISRAEDIPEKFALKILRDLSQAKIVNSYRGLKGGYNLRVSPDRTNIRDIIEAVQGKLTMTQGLKEIKSRDDLPFDVIDRYFYELQEDVRKRLTTKTIASLANDERNME